MSLDPTGISVAKSETRQPVLQLPFGRDVIFTINSRMAGPAVMSCVDMQSEFVALLTDPWVDLAS